IQDKGLPSTKAKSYQQRIYAMVFPYTYSDTPKTISIILRNILGIGTYDVDVNQLSATVIAFNRYAADIYNKINNIYCDSSGIIYDRTNYIKSTSEYKSLEEDLNKTKVALTKIVSQYNALATSYNNLNNSHVELLKKIN